MTVEMIREFFAWCTAINIGILLIWILVLALAKDWAYRANYVMFKITKDQFDAIHYRLMGNFKLGIFMFNLVPYIAFRIVG